MFLWFQPSIVLTYTLFLAVDKAPLHKNHQRILSQVLAQPFAQVTLNEFLLSWAAGIRVGHTYP